MTPNQPIHKHQSPARRSIYFWIDLIFWTILFFLTLCALLLYIAPAISRIVPVIFP